MSNPEPVPLTTREIRDEKRGYSINIKYVVIAYIFEAVLVITSLVGAALFARMYAHDDRYTFLMMMLAPISYAVVESCRIPLALAARTNRSWIIRFVAIVGVFCAAGVTVKSLSQLGEQMFHPRLIDVVMARETLNVAERERKVMTDRIAAADAAVEQRTGELKAVDERSQGLTAQMAGVAKPTCMKVSGHNKKGAWSSMRCSPDPKAEIISANLRLASADHSAASTKLDQARKERDALDPGPLDQKVSDAKKAYREAVLHSQLHSFTAMMFGKDPGEVDDAEVHRFLRLFVFLPAVFASMATTLLALSAVNRVKAPKAAPERLPDEAGQYILGGLAEHIIRETTERVHRQAAADAAVGAAAGARSPAPAVALKSAA
jgi:hypothetical protein